MRRIAVINQKGGVGKTTTCANLGAALALAGQRVVLVDMDPQANLSMHLGQELFSQDPSTYTILVGQTPFEAALRATTVPGLSVVPAHIDLSGAELELASAIGRETLLRDALDEWERNSFARTGRPPADFLLLDCPPSLGLLSVNALAAAQEVLIAVQTEFFALQGMSKLVEVVQLLRRRLNPDLRIRGILPCLYDNRLRLAREVLAEVRRYFPGQVFRTSIRTNVKLAEAPSHGLTIFEYDPSCSGATDHANLAEEILAQAGAAPGVGGQVSRAPEEAADEGPRAEAFEERIAEMARGERRATLRPQPPRPTSREVESPESSSSASPEETLLPNTQQMASTGARVVCAAVEDQEWALRYPVGGALAPMSALRLTAAAPCGDSGGSTAVEEVVVTRMRRTSTPFTVQIDEIVPVATAQVDAAARPGPQEAPPESVDGTPQEVGSRTDKLTSDPLCTEEALHTASGGPLAAVPDAGHATRPDREPAAGPPIDEEGLATVEVPRPAQAQVPPVERTPTTEPAARLEEAPPELSLEEEDVPSPHGAGEPAPQTPTAALPEPLAETAAEVEVPLARAADAPEACAPVACATEPELVSEEEPIVELLPEPAPPRKPKWNFAGFAGEDRPRMAGPMGPRTP